MPDDNTNKNAGGGDDAGVAAKAAADKAAADAAAAGEETVTVKKADFEKNQTDLENYRKMGNSYKTDAELWRESQKSKGAGDDGNKGDGSGGQGDGKTATFDETKVGQVATEAARKVQRESSEKTARRAFIKAHPEYANDSDYQRMIVHLTFKGGETTHEDVLDRLEAALLEDKRSSGKLDEHFNTIREQGRQEGRSGGSIDAARDAGGSGDRGGEGGVKGGFSSGQGESMARAMHTDPEKAKKMDPSKDNVINVI